MKKHVFTVTAGEAGLSLEALLRGRLGANAGPLDLWIRGGSAALDGRRMLDPAREVIAGQRVVLRTPEDGGRIADMDLAPPLQIAYRSRAVAVVAKPNGMPSTPTRAGGAITLDALVLKRLGPLARLMHRLDRGASGLVLVSLLAGPTRKALATQISEHRTRRLYLALVQQWPGVEELRLDQPLAMEHGRSRPSSDPRARPALTLVRPVRRLAADRWLVQAEPRTGRTHQIRAHLAAAGLAILGDERYGGGPAERLCLHAHSLRFRDPDSGGEVEAHCPLAGQSF